MNTTSEAMHDYSLTSIEDQLFKCIIDVGCLSTALESINVVGIIETPKCTTIELSANMPSTHEMFNQLTFFKEVFHHIFTLRFTPLDPSPDNEEIHLYHNKFNIGKLSYNPVPEASHHGQLLITFISINKHMEIVNEMPDV